MFVILFLATGIGNASTFQMIPIIMRSEMARLMPSLGAADRLRHAEKGSAAIIGFTSAIAAYGAFRSEEHTSELQSLMRISYAVFCLKKKKKNTLTNQLHRHIN